MAGEATACVQGCSSRRSGSEERSYRVSLKPSFLDLTVSPGVSEICTVSFQQKGTEQTQCTVANQLSGGEFFIDNRPLYKQHLKLVRRLSREAEGCCREWKFGCEGGDRTIQLSQGMLASAPWPLVSCPWSRDESPLELTTPGIVCVCVWRAPTSACLLWNRTVMVHDVRDLDP